MNSICFQEISVVEAENKHQQNCSAAEMQQYINKKCEIELQDFELHLKEMRNQLSKIRNSVRKCETEITIAERDVERLNLKIDDLSKSVTIFCCKNCFMAKKNVLFLGF